jgi:hypothetical protein
MSTRPTTSHAQRRQPERQFKRQRPVSCVAAIPQHILQDDSSRPTTPVPGLSVETLKALKKRFDTGAKLVSLCQKLVEEFTGTETSVEELHGVLSNVLNEEVRFTCDND